MLSLFFFLAAIPLSAAQLTVYASESVLGKGSLGEAVQKEFEKNTKHKVRFVPFSASGEGLNQVELEGKASKADVVLGVDRNWLGRAHKQALYAPIPAAVSASVPAALNTDSLFLPYDYGFLAFVYDSRRTQPPATVASLDSFLESVKGARVAIQDPRTSSLGYSFLLWSRGVWGESWAKKAPVLANPKWTIGSGWSGTYGLFLKGEVDYVLSYTTSPAYHIEKEQNNAIKSVAFADGQFLQVEGALVPKSSRQQKVAHEFLKTLLSPAVQNQIATTNWMYPVLAGATVPSSFEKPATASSSSLSLTPEQIESKREEWLKTWVQVVSGKPL